VIEPVMGFFFWNFLGSGEVFMGNLGSQENSPGQNATHEEAEKAKKEEERHFRARMNLTYTPKERAGSNPLAPRDASSSQLASLRTWVESTGHVSPATLARWMAQSEEDHQVVEEDRGDEPQIPRVKGVKDRSTEFVTAEPAPKMEREVGQSFMTALAKFTGWTYLEVSSLIFSQKKQQPDWKKLKTIINSTQCLRERRQDDNLTVAPTDLTKEGYVIYKDYFYNPAGEEFHQSAECLDVLILLESWQACRCLKKDKRRGHRKGK